MGILANSAYVRRRRRGNRSFARRHRKPARHGEEQMAFAEGAITIGALAAMIVGTVAYFVIKGDVSLKQFSTTVFG